MYSWAKAPTKPSYGWSEIGSKPSTFTPSAHTHNVSDISGLSVDTAITNAEIDAIVV